MVFLYRFLKSKKMIIWGLFKELTGFRPDSFAYKGLMGPNHIVSP